MFGCAASASTVKTSTASSALRGMRSTPSCAVGKVARACCHCASSGNACVSAAGVAESGLAMRCDDAVQERAGFALDELEAMQPLGKAEDAAVLVLLAERLAAARVDVDLLAVEEAHLRRLAARANSHVVDLRAGMGLARGRNDGVE